MRKLTVVLVPLSSFISHVTRCLSIADELRSRGHHAEFICSESNRELIESNGYKTHLGRQLNHAQIVVTGAPKSYLERYQQATGNQCDHAQKFGLKEMATDDLRILKEIRPDVVISDASPTAFLTATVLNIPCLMIKNILGYIGSGHVYANKHLHLKLEEELDFAIELKMSKEFQTDCGKLNQAYIDNQKSIPLLIPGVPEIEKIKGHNLLAHHPCSFIGNLEWKGWKNMFSPRVTKDLDKTVILVSMGSSFPFEKVIRSIISCFDDDAFRIIINTGGQVQIPDNLSRSKNYEIHPFLNLEDFLKISDVLICHGGHGSIMSAFKTGTPSLCIPFNGDQMVISRQVQDLECGLRIKRYPDDITGDQLKESVQRLLADPKFAQNAKQHGVLLKNHGNGAANAVDYIERFYDNRQWSIETTSQIENVLQNRAAEIEKSGSKVLFALENRTDEKMDYLRWMAHELKTYGHSIGLLFNEDAPPPQSEGSYELFRTATHMNSLLEQLEVADEFSPSNDCGNDFKESELLNLLQKRMKEDKNIVEEFKPDLIIDAGRLGCSILSDSMDIPSAKMSSFDYAESSESIDKQRLIQRLNSVLAKLKSQFINPETEHTSPLPNLVLAPTVPSIFHAINGQHSGKVQTIFLGGMENEVDRQSRVSPASLYLDKTVVLVVLDDHIQLASVLETIRSIEWLSDTEVIAVCTAAPNGDQVDSVIYGVDLNAFVKISDLVIHSGSYESLHAALKFKKPSLLIPNRASELALTNHAIKEGWGTAIIKSASEISAEELQSIIHELIEEKESIQRTMEAVCNELHFWDNGGLRGAYAINQFMEKRTIQANL